MQARWADASRIKCVPIVPTSAEPVVFLAGRPATERAADAWAGWFVGLVFLKLAVGRDGRIVHDQTHLDGYLAGSM
jgi:hypothetical protein